MEPIEYHTELIRRERSQRYCEVCRHRRATITVSSWTTSPQGASPARSYYFCTVHAAEAEALLDRLQAPHP